MQPTSSLPTSWQSPPEPINTILDAPNAPDILFSPSRQWMVELERPLLHPIAALAEPEVAIAGLRINPKTNSLARQHPYHRLTIKALETGVTIPVDLPATARIQFVDWSCDEQRLAFVLVQENGLELWMFDLANQTLHQLTDAVLNATQGFPYQWLPGDAGLIGKVIPAEWGSPPESAPVPPAPLIEENLGRTTANRTYTNLLKNAHDEALFEYYVTSALEHIALDGTRTRLVAPALIHHAIPSPDGEFILVATWHRPFSYQVPVELFPKRTEVLDRTGARVYAVADLPLADDLSIKFDSVRPGRRYASWRGDRPATLYWIEALDGGDAGLQVPLRDALLELDAPFTAEPTILWKSEYRFRQIIWGNDTTALAWEQWYDNRKQRIWRLNPSQPGTPHLLVDRSFEDRYRDPGTPLTQPGHYGWNLLRFTPDNTAIYLKGRGASPRGVYPFLDQMDLITAATERLWQADDPYYELVVDMGSTSADALITYRQSPSDPPNYFLRGRNGAQLTPLTHYQDPAPQLAGIHREVVRYHRRDGVQLSATLYLPPHYQPDRDGPLPTIFWAYPQEFKDSDAASQVTTAQNSFSRPTRASILFLLTQGYAIFNDPSLPILGEGDAEPNDSYVEQLIAGAEAAVEYVVNRGVADRDRLGIGGHSYGAFTTANLLAHTDLFQAGVARSGAYNRTLTPFGFQGEQRNFWEVPDIYTHLSPFTHAAAIKKPLLLIHGASDSNTGTYPMQSERFYQALKGLGAVVRLVMLPFEDHGYYSREGVGHTLWEMVQWFDRYVKQTSGSYTHS